MPHMAAEFCPDCPGIGIVAVRGDPIRGYAGHRLCRSKEGLGGGKVAVLTQHHVDQGASAIDRAIQIPPTTTRFHQLPPIEGVAEALASLTLPICVASSSNLEQIRQKLEIT